MEISSSSNQPNVDNLPDHIYHNILFKHLNLDDVWSMRLVNKKLYSIVKSYQIFGLSFVCRCYRYCICRNSYSYSIYRSNWFSTTKSIKRKNQYHSCILYQLILNSNYHLHLKCLKIHKCDPLPFELTTLNIFKQLQILDISPISIKTSDLLQLPDLRALSVAIKCGKLTVDAPSLNSLSIYKHRPNTIVTLIKFKYPLSIKYLVLDTYEKNATIFQNLEHLEIDFFNFDSYLDDILRFRKLKKLTFNSFRFNCLVDKIDMLKCLFTRNDLKMVLYGVKIKDINMLYDYIEKLGIQLNNYGKLENELLLKIKINYSELELLLIDNQISDLFKKYTHLQYMQIEGRIMDESRLISFISKCPNLFELEVHDSMIGQQFYDQLADVSSLSYLRVFGDSYVHDFTFINKMVDLVFIHVDKDVLLGKDLDLSSLEYLKVFSFKINRDTIKIYIKDGNQYSLDADCVSVDEEEWFDQNEIIKWTCRLRSFLSSWWIGKLKISKDDPWL